jgi:uncharacterized membrane protein (UPF0127 family)
MRAPGWILVSMLCLALGCSSSAAPNELVTPPSAHAGTSSADVPPAAATPRVTLLPPGMPAVEVAVELAVTPAERSRGLMYRKHLGESDGMLFLFEREQPQSFWMHNTYIPLDMIFIREDLTVLGVVENAEPETDSSRNVPGSSRYVLEVNAGFARKHGIRADVPVRFEGVTGF